MPDENTATPEEIEARVRAEYQGKLQALEDEKTKILGNKDQILAEKKELEGRYKSFDDEKMQGYQNYLKELETNEEMRLISEGKHDEVIQRRMAGREKAWNETQAEYEDRLKAAQGKADEYSTMLEEANAKNVGMQKRQYLKDLTSGDDSFKGDYFGDFYDLYSKRVDIDESTGAMFALGEDNKRMVDTSGDFVKFDEFYAKQKVNHGLFWNGGNGSGVKGGPGQDILGGDPFKWNKEQKREFVAQNGRQAYSDLLAKNNRA